MDDDTFLSSVANSANSTESQDSDCDMSEEELALRKKSHTSRNVNVSSFDKFIQKLKHADFAWYKGLVYLRLNNVIGYLIRGTVGL